MCEVNLHQPLARKEARVRRASPNSQFDCIVAIAQELLTVNHDWLGRLTEKVQDAVGAMPQHFRGDNGDDFTRDSFTDNALVYAIIQAMKAGQRRDPKHFDGGCSILHLGLTIFGLRMLQFWFEDGTTQTMEQKPGSLYVGNLCAVEHQVVHVAKKDVGQLYVDGGKPGFQITVMIRSDFFRHARARKLEGKPTPIGLYDTVNEIVARHLSLEPLKMPTFAKCVARFHAMQPAASTADTQPRRKKLKSVA